MSVEAGTAPKALADLDRIELRGVTAIGHHGMLDFERTSGQPFVVDATLYVDASDAIASDSGTHVPDYADVAQTIVNIVSGEPLHLIETLASKIANAILLDHRVRAIDLTVHKPQAPLDVEFADIAVTITRTAEDNAQPHQAAGESAVVPAPEVVPIVEPVPVAIDPLPAAIQPAAPEPAEPELEPQLEPLAPAASQVRPDEPIQVVLSLGSNVGDALAELNGAVDELADAEDVDIIAVSPLARTAPVGDVEQPDFFNIVLIVSTLLSPRELLELTQATEDAHGRDRSVPRGGPRTLDIDIVTYGTELIAEDGLEIPHPRAGERAFVLVPWAAVQPAAFLPGLGGGPISVLAESAPDRLGVRWLALDWRSENGPARFARENDASEAGAQAASAQPRGESPVFAPAAAQPASSTPVFQEPSMPRSPFPMVPPIAEPPAEPSTTALAGPDGDGAPAADEADAPGGADGGDDTPHDGLPGQGADQPEDAEQADHGDAADQPHRGGVPDSSGFDAPAREVAPSWLLPDQND